MKRCFIRSIKRLCYRSSKRLIRFLIYFHILVCFLTFSVSAKSLYEYDSFQDLAYNGGISTSVLRDGYWYPKWSIDGFDYFNDFTVADSDPFTGVRFTVYDAPLINLPFVRNDVVYIKQCIVLNVDGRTSTSLAEVRNNFTLTIDTDLKNSITDPYRNSFSVSGTDIVSNVRFVKRGIDSYDDIYIYLDGFIRLSPEDTGNITQISYSIGNMSTNTVHVRVYPQSNTSYGYLTYYVGSLDNAPSYSSPDSSQVDNYHNEEDALLDGAFAQNPLQKFQSIFGDVQGYITSLELNKCFSVWSFWFFDLIGYKWFSAFVYFSITLGLFAFVFSVARDGVNVGYRSSKSHKNTSINNQRNSNFKE